MMTTHDNDPSFPLMPRSGARGLAAVLGMASEPPHETGKAAAGTWGPQELGTVLRHQWDAPVEPDLRRLSPEVAKRFDEARTASTLPAATTFGELFAHPRPPLAALEAVKDFAKLSTTADDAPLPEEVAAVVYYSAILAARTRCGTRITSLDDALLAEGARWALSLPWVEGAARRLLAEGLESVGTGGEKE